MQDDCNRCKTCVYNGYGEKRHMVVQHLMHPHTYNRCNVNSTYLVSTAIFGLLLAYGLTYPNRPLLLFMLFPVPARYAVMIFGAIELVLSVGDIGGGIAHITHLGGLAAGYAILRSGRFHPVEEARYRYLRWKMERARKKFGVYSGGRKDDWDKHVH